MISRDKLVALLSNTKFKKINLPNNIQYTQLSFFDTKKKEYDEIISNFKILNNKSNVLDVISNNKEDLSNYYDNVLNTNDDINDINNNYKNNKVNYDTYLNYSENDKVILPEILNNIFNDKSTNNIYQDDKIFLYGVKNPESYFKTILVLNNIEFIVKNKYESNQALLTFKKKLAYTLQTYYDNNNFKLFPEKYFNPQKVVKNILNKENYVDIGIHQYICMHLKKNILIFNLQDKSFIYFSYKLNNDMSTINNDCYIIINNNGVYLPCMNTNKKHLFNKDVCNYIKNKYSWENYEMYLKFDESKQVIDARHKKNNNNTNNTDNTDIIGFNPTSISINNNNKINFSVNNKINNKDNKVNIVNIDDIQKDFQPKIKKKRIKKNTSQEEDTKETTKETTKENTKKNINENNIKNDKIFILDDIKSYKLNELQKLAESKKLPIMKKGKTKDIKKTKQELYNELKGLFK
tara:strand:- start:1899 stop:3290 length:1392 start_codon:yes stop_codon:yes gene_type:complete